MRSTDASTATYKEALCELALHEARGRRLVFQELPSAHAKRVVQIGIDSGFLTSADHTHIEIHPLLQEFLFESSRKRGPPDLRELWRGRHGCSSEITSGTRHNA